MKKKLGLLIVVLLLGAIVVFGTKDVEKISKAFSILFPGINLSASSGKPGMSEPTIPKTSEADSADDSETKDKTVIAKSDDGDVYKWEAEEVIGRLMASQNLKAKPYDSFQDEEKLAVVKEIVTKRILQKNIDKSKIASEKEIQKNLKIITSEVIQNEFLTRKAKASLTPETVKERYQKIVTEVEGKEELRLRHILVETEQDAKKIHEEVIKKPESFAEIAKAQSKDPTSVNGGDTGFALETTIVKEIRDIALGLKKGEISDPIKTQSGWNIIKLEDRRKTNIAKFDTIKDKLQQEFIQENIQLYLKSLLDGKKVELVAKP